MKLVVGTTRKQLSTEIIPKGAFTRLAEVCIPVRLIEKTENWRSLDTSKRKLSSWENSICVTVKLWDCKRPTAFHVPTCHSHISATDADWACKIHSPWATIYTKKIQQQTKKQVWLKRKTIRKGNKFVNDQPSVTNIKNLHLQCARHVFLQLISLRWHYVVSSNSISIKLMLIF